MQSDLPSMQTSIPTERYRVGNLVVDVQARRVVRGGEEVHLTELSFDVLVALLRRAPAIVSKKTLMREVWPGIVVEPDTVKKRIALLRASLEDDDPAAPLIRVARGRGYGINADVERLDRVTRPTRFTGRRRITATLAGSAFIVSIIAVGLALRSGNDGVRQSSETESVSNLEETSQDDPDPAIASSSDIGAIDPVAYQLYLKGKMLRRTGHDLANASMALERAIDIEPRFAAAVAELALCRLVNPFRPESKQQDSLASGRELAKRARQLDPTLPEAVAAAAAVAIFLDWDWTEAEALLEQGLAASPGNEYLQAYRAFLSAIHGDLDRSIRLLKVVVAHDITYARLHYSLGQRYYQAMRFREAIEAYRQALALSPRIEFAHLGIGRIRALQGDHAAALSEMDLEPSPILRLYGLAIAHTAAGDERAAVAVLEDLEKTSGSCCNYWLGSLHAYRGDADSAFRFFESAWTAREWGLLEIKIDPLLEGVRGDPRYTQLVARMNLD